MIIQITTKSMAQFMRYDSLNSRTTKFQFPICERPLVTERAATGVNWSTALQKIECGS